MSNHLNKQTASVSEEQKDTQIKINVSTFNTNCMESIITPTVFVDEKTKTRPEVVVLGTLEMWGYRPPYDDNWPITHDGRPVKRPGSMYYDDHKWHFKPFSLTGAKRYDLLYATTYARVKRTRRDTIIEIRIPDSLPEWERLRVLAHEMKLVSQFLKSQVSKQRRKEAA